MRKLLVVEDDEGLRSLLTARLEKSGFGCLSTDNGLEALNIIQKNQPDLVILDLGIPGLSGQEVCKEIRKDANTKNLPIIMLTGKDTDVDRVIGKVIGANCYLTKPCEVSILLEKIKVLLGN